MAAPRPQPSSRVPDLSEVRRLLLERMESGSAQSALDLMVEMLSRLQSENSQLALRLDSALRQLYQRRTEKVSTEQLALLLSTLSAEDQQSASTTAPEPPPRTEALVPDRTRRAAPHGRKPIPVAIARVESKVALEGVDRLCPECQREREPIGDEKTELLEYVPGHFEVQVTLREKLACARCETAISTPPVPEQPIARGRPGPGLLAHLLVAKYQDHLPIHRQAGIFARDGLSIPTSTLYGWQDAALDTLAPLVDSLAVEILAAYHLQADATGLRVLDRDNPNGSVKGHLWGYLGDGKKVVFRYAAGKGEGVDAFLAHRRGNLQGDGDSALPSEAECLERGLLRFGCWMHARRYFQRALEANDARASVALCLIAKVYAIEAQATEEGVSPEERSRRRQQFSRPLFDEMGRWVAREHPNTPPSTRLGRAFTYAIRQWPALYRVLDDGRVPLDNGALERAIRPIAVGRGNWLFSGSDDGARRLAIAFSLLGTCRLAAVDPRVYLRDVLSRIAAGWPQRRIGELLPHAWAEERRQQSAAQPAVSS